MKTYNKDSHLDLVLTQTELALIRAMVFAYFKALETRQVKENKISVIIVIDEQIIASCKNLKDKIFGI